MPMSLLTPFLGPNPVAIEFLRLQSEVFVLTKEAFTMT